MSTWDRLVAGETIVIEGLVQYRLKNGSLQTKAPSDSNWVNANYTEKDFNLFDRIFPTATILTLNSPCYSSTTGSNPWNNNPYETFDPAPLKEESITEALYNFRYRD